MIVRTPDGKWAIYSSALRILTRVGLDERDALSVASEELGSIDKARAALADVESWDAVLRLMDEPTRKALARRYGVEAPPLSPATIRQRELAAEGRARVAEGRARRAEVKAEQRAAAPAKPRPVVIAPTPRDAPRPRTPPDERAAVVARKAGAAHKRAQRVAVYLLFGTYSRAANLCGCSPEGIESALRLAGVAKIEKRTPLAAEVERTMRSFGFEEKAIARALKHAKT